jgi:hypothetical protein
MQSPFAKKHFTRRPHIKCLWRRPEYPEIRQFIPALKGTSPFRQVSGQDAVQGLQEKGTKKRIYATNTGSFEPLRGHILFSPGTIFYYKDNTIIFNKLQQDFNNSFNNLSKVVTITVPSEL